MQIESELQAKPPSFPAASAKIQKDKRVEATDEFWQEFPIGIISL